MNDELEHRVTVLEQQVQSLLSLLDPPEVVKHALGATEEKKEQNECDVERVGVTAASPHPSPSLFDEPPDGRPENEFNDDSWHKYEASNAAATPLPTRLNRNF